MRRQDSSEKYTDISGIHHHFARYEVEKINHEAGYDSLLTAQVFIKLSAQLGRYQVGLNENVTTTKTHHGLNNRFSQLDVGQTSRDLISIESDNDSEEVLGEYNHADESRKARRGHLIPRPNFQFWKVFGNKLRVFGTTEKICHIG